MTKCIICEQRPAKGSGFCSVCGDKINSANNRKANSKAAGKPAHFLTYRGDVVGLFPNGNGTLKPRLLNRNPEHLPKSKTLDLNTYLPGFTREVIKRFKACVLRLASA